MITGRLRRQPRRGKRKVIVSITSFMGSMPFVYLHVAFYGAWVLAAFGILPGIPKFDPYFAGLARPFSFRPSS